MISAILEFDFLRNALITSVFISVICGIIGTVIVEKKLVMMSGGIAHTAYGGVGMGYLLGFEPIIGAGIFAVGASLGIGALRRRAGNNVDLIISMLWALGMALGIAFIALMPGYPADINTYLFGNILLISPKDLCISAAVCALLFILTLVFYNDIKAYMFDEGFSAIMGMRVKLMEYATLVAISLSVVTLLRASGIILVIALLSAPCACAALISKNLKNRMIISSLFCLAFCLIGIILSYELDIPSGATIIFVSVITYALILTVSKLSELRRRSA